MLSLTVFLSYLPEAGEYASFFVYLRLVSLLRPVYYHIYIAFFLGYWGLMYVAITSCALYWAQCSTYNHTVVCIAAQDYGVHL